MAKKKETPKKDMADVAAKAIGSLAEKGAKKLLDGAEDKAVEMIGKVVPGGKRKVKEVDHAIAAKLSSDDEGGKEQKSAAPKKATATKKAAATAGKTTAAKKSTAAKKETSTTKAAPKKAATATKTTAAKKPATAAKKSK